MCTLINQTKQTARKRYGCMASEWLNHDISEWSYLMTYAEARAYIRARRNNFDIQPGQRYVRQAMKADGLYTFRAIPEIHAICLRLDVYDC